VVDELPDQAARQPQSFRSDGPFDFKKAYLLLLKRLFNFLPLATGVLIFAWGLLGLLGPANPPASAASIEDLSLDASGFELQEQVTTPVFRRSWVKVDPGAHAITPTLNPTPTSTVTLVPSVAATSSELPTALAPAASMSQNEAKAKIEAPAVEPGFPDRIVIPAIQLDAPVVEAPSRTLTLQQQVFEQWLAPEAFAAGWHSGSALLGQAGNTVLNGHHNIDGKVFAGLVELKPGDKIFLYAGEREFQYVVAQSMVLKERGASLTEREANARWILPSSDERITLVTCWPAHTNTHRLLVVASPLP
jgi:LPXTG-site transpeptidase (sortase) family protein